MCTLFSVFARLGLTTALATFVKLHARFRFAAPLSLQVCDRTAGPRVDSRCARRLTISTTSNRRHAALFARSRSPAPIAPQQQFGARPSCLCNGKRYCVL